VTGEFKAKEFKASVARKVTDSDWKDRIPAGSRFFQFEVSKQQSSAHRPDGLGWRSARQTYPKRRPFERNSIMSANNGLAQRNTVRSSIKRLWLSTAVLSLLSSPSFAQQVIANGTVVDVPSDTTIDTGLINGDAGIGLYAIWNGEIKTHGPVTVVTGGEAAVGAQAYFGGVINLQAGSSIATAGNYAAGIVAALRDSSVTAVDTSIHTKGDYAQGVYVQEGKADLTNVSIVTEGTASVGVSAETSSTVTMTGGTVTTHGDTSSGILVSNAGAILNADGVVVSTNGDRSHGVVASQGAILTLTNSSVSTSRDNSMGVIASNENAFANLIDTEVTTTGDGSHGIDIYSGGTVNATNVDVTTAGDWAYGLSADGDKAQGNIYGGSYSTGGFRADGINAANGGEINIGRDLRTGEATLIRTTGDGAAGVRSSAGSVVNLDGATIITEGNGTGNSWAVGVIVANGGTAKLNNTNIVTSGERGAGFNVTDTGSHLEMSGGSITTSGVNAGGAVAYNSGTANLNNVVITTANSRGVVAGDIGGILTMNGGSVTTKGDDLNGSAAYAVRGGLVDLTNVELRTEGADARGLHAFGAGSTVSAKGSRVTTTGAGAHGAFASGGGAVTVANSSVQTEGIGAHGLVAQNGSTVQVTNTIARVSGVNGAGIALASDSMAVVDGSLIATANGPALKTSGGSVGFELKNGTQVVGGNGTLLQAAAGSTTMLAADGNVVLSGDMVVESNDTVIDASLSNSSIWTGAGKGVTSVAVDSTSYWLMSGSSDVGALTNDGTIEFDSATPYKALTVGSLTMDNGSFVLNTKLNEGGAASETDKIVVTGDTTGLGVVKVRNNGGIGAFTGTGATDGIQIVEVGGQSNAEFKLGSAAIVGIYDYQLRKADGQNWYLQTDGKDVIEPPVCTPDVDCPVEPPVNPGPGTGHVVDIVPGYNIALAAAQNHVLTTLDTFHERLGELRAEDLRDGYNVWMRGIGKTGSYSPKSITGYNGHGFDMTTAGAQIGVDYSKGDVFIAGDKLTVGIFGEYANSSFDVRGRTADGSISSKGLGGYVTWQQVAPSDYKPGTGVYVDAVIKHDWIDFGVSAKSVSGFALQNSYKGRATTASIEAGYGFDLGNNVVLQPQAQLIYSKIKADSFTDTYGIHVYDQSAESLIGRVGVRLEKTIYFGDEEEVSKPASSAIKGRKGSVTKKVPAVFPDAPQKKKFVKSVTTYADANVKREFKGKNGLVASGASIGNDMSGTAYDVGVGVVARVSENVSLYARGAVEFGGSTNVAGKASGGLKISW
jgi:outer membrane autotransporter protein